MTLKSLSDPAIAAADPITNPKKRMFYSLDGIRGTASLIIVTRHTVDFFDLTTPVDSFLAVDLFFVLSGVVLCYSYENKLKHGLSAARFAWIRIVRIYPLYLLGTALMIVSTLTINARIDPHSLGTYSIVALLLLPYLGAAPGAVFFPLNGPAWSLFEELTVNFVYGSVARYLTTRNLLIIMAVSAAGMAIYVHAISGFDIGWKTIIWHGLNIGIIGGLFRVGYSFFFGVLIYRLFAARAWVDRTGPLAAAIPWAILLVVAAILEAAPPPSLRSLFDLTAAWVLFPALVYLALHFQPTGMAARVFKFFGLVSFAVYAIHYPLGVLVEDLLHYRWGVIVRDYAPWAGFAFLAVLIPLCWLLDYVYDAPLRRFLLSLGRSGSSRKAPQG